MSRLKVFYFEWIAVPVIFLSFSVFAFLTALVMFPLKFFLSPKQLDEILYQLTLVDYKSLKSVLTNILTALTKE